MVAAASDAGSDLATSSATCCVVGGGPAGTVLGLLLARAGIPVVVLEKHADFLRDFRGDTFHPSTLDLMHELGYLPDLLNLPHQEIHTLRGQIGNGVFAIADFSHLPTRCKFLTIMPQWDFLLEFPRQAGLSLSCVPFGDAGRNDRADRGVRSGGGRASADTKRTAGGSR